MKKILLMMLCLFSIVGLVNPVHAEFSDDINNGYEIGTVLYEFDENGNLVEHVVTDEDSITEDELNNHNISFYEAVSYSLVQIKNDGSEVEIDLFDVLEDAKNAYDDLCNKNSNLNYAIKQGDNYIQIKYGVVVFKRIKKTNSSGNSYISTTDYSNANSGISGYLHVDQGLDAAYLETKSGKVTFKMAGVTGLVDESLVNVVPYAKNSTKVDYYKVVNDNLIHYVRLSSLTSTGKYSSIHVGYAPSYLESDVTYYSFDGHYFYDSYFKMIDDYRMGSFENAVNQEPYYNYYQFLPMHSMTTYTADEINQYIDYKMTEENKSKSVIYNRGGDFIQEEINVNPIITLGIAINESGWGTNCVAENNIFGLNAIDSNPSGSANKYVSVESCIEIFMQQHITHGYLDTKKDSRYLGGHLGDKESGINVRYASDPYWGEKAAAHCYSLDSYLGYKDYGKYTLGIKESYDAMNIHKRTSSSSDVIYQMKNTYANHTIANMPVIIFYEGSIWYKIYTDHLLDENQDRIVRNGEPLSWLYDQYYNFDYSYGCVKKENIRKINLSAVSSIDASNFNVKTKYTAMTYTGTERKPSITVTDLDGNIISDSNYIVEYSDNINVGTAKVTVTFKGDYKGKITKTFKIKQKDASDFSAKLSYTKYTYNGKTKTPTVTVTDTNGKELVKDVDYTVSFVSSTRKNVGRYSATVNYIGNYKGSKKLWFTIVPAAVETMNVELYGYDDIEVNWSKSTGASGYHVYYKLNKDTEYTLASNTTECTFKLANLKDGYKYNVKIVPYYATSSGKIYDALKYTTDSTNTLIKIKEPTVSKYSDTKVKVTFKNIYGETGYEVSRSSSSTGTYIVSRFNSTSATSRVVNSTANKTYYYKVRAYYTREDGTKIYGPWSTSVKYVLK